MPNQTDYIEGYYSDSYNLLNDYLGFNAFLAIAYGVGKTTGTGKQPGRGQFLQDPDNAAYVSRRELINPSHLTQKMSHYVASCRMAGEVRLLRRRQSERLNLSLIGSSTGSESPDDSVTITMPDGQVWTGPSIDEPINAAFIGIDSSATFTVTVKVPGTDSSGNARVWQIDAASLSTDGGFATIGSVPVDVGGETYLPLSLSADNTDLPAAGQVMRLVGYDPGVIQPVGSGSVTMDSTGHGELLVKGVGYGTTPIIVEDAIGDIAEVPFDGDLNLTTSLPGVTAVGTVTEGASSDPTPGFTFSVPFASVTPVTVNFNTSGSTLPQSVMDQLGTMEQIYTGTDSGGSTFVPFTMADDGKVAPDRYAVVNLDVPGDPATATNGLQAQLKVVNSDKPIIKLNGDVDHAVIKLDPQGLDANLTKITLDDNVADGVKVNSTTIYWNADAFTMWLTDKVGQPGTDLSTGPGYNPDAGNGSVSYTWAGEQYPHTIYGQDLTGSDGWNTTQVTLTVNDMTAPQPAAAVSTGSASNTASGTANGPELIYKSKVVNGVLADQMLIGQGASLSVIWSGPKPDSTGINTFAWNASSGIGGFASNGSAGQLLPLISTDSDFHLYWGPEGKNGGHSSQSVSCSGELDGNAFSLNTYFDVWTPTWSFTRKGNIGKATDKGSGRIQLLSQNNSGSAIINGVAYTFGVVYTGTVTDNGIPTNLVGGQWSITQLATPNATLILPGKGPYSMYHTGIEGLDTYNHASFDQFDPINNAGNTTPVYAPVGPTSHEYADSPGVVLPKVVAFLGFNPVPNATFRYHIPFRTFLMFSPPGEDCIDVPLAVATWQSSFGAKSSLIRGSGQQGRGIVVWNLVQGSVGARADPFGRATTEIPEWTYTVIGSDFRKGF